MLRRLSCHLQTGCRGTSMPRVQAHEVVGFRQVLRRDPGGGPMCLILALACHDVEFMGRGWGRGWACAC